MSKVDDYQVYIIAPSEIKVGENASIIIEAPEDATGNITIIDKDKNYTKELNNNTITIDISGLVLGNNNLIVVYSGNKKYAEKNRKCYCNC